MLCEVIAPKRNVSQAPIKLTTCHAGCGKAVQYRTTPRVNCPDCKRDRVLATSREISARRLRDRGVPRIKGTDAECRRCDKRFVRRGRGHVSCDDCAPDVARDRARKYQRRKWAGLKEHVGTLKKCANNDCREEFKKAKKGKQIYCPSCMSLQKAGKLPSLRLSISKWRKKRLANDPKFALNSIMRSGIRNSLGSGAKAGRAWESLVGYSVDELKRHLERQFLPKMTWANRGGVWQIDHILPLSGFTFSCAEDAEFRAAWALSNLRPLWKNENYEKRAKRLHLI